MHGQGGENPVEKVVQTILAATVLQNVKIDDIRSKEPVDSEKYNNIEELESQSKKTVPQNDKEKPNLLAESESLRKKNLRHTNNETKNIDPNVQKTKKLIVNTQQKNFHQSDRHHNQRNKNSKK